jgi:hypothetical protein
MILIRVGQLTLNLDWVVAVRDLPSSASQPATAGGVRIELCDGRQIDVLDAPEAMALRAWLADHTQDVASS